MKKILAIVLAVVMTLSMVVSTAAVNTVNDDTTSATETVDATASIGGIEGFFKAIYDAIHSLVHALSVRFDFECPFCHGKDDSNTPENPSDKPSDPSDDNTSDEDAIEISAADLAALLAAEPVNNCIAVELDNSYIVTDEWTSISYPTANAYIPNISEFSFDGKGHTISGLTAPLFVGNVATKIEIKNLTISNSEVVSGNENGLGKGAFIAYADHNVTDLSFENCSLVNSTVTAATDETNAGAFVGNNIQTNFSVKDCKVTNCNINGKNAGAIVGFCQTDSNSTQIIENCKVTNCNISGKYTGKIAGTVNSNGELTISGCGFTAEEAVGRITSGTTVTIK